MRGRQAVERLTVPGLARPAPEGVATPIVRPGCEVSVFTIIDGAVITLFDGPRPPIGVNLRGVSRGRRRVKPLCGSSASLRPFG